MGLLKDLEEALKLKKLQPHPNWKGDAVGYSGLHMWVRQNKQKPQACEWCGEIRKLEWANLSHQYKRDLDDWAAVCVSCHRRYDSAYRKTKKQEEEKVQ